MHPMEKIITEAMLGTTDREVAMCRVSCNTAASSAMFCGQCNNVLDQTTTIVTTIKTPVRRVVLACCRSCWDASKESMLEAAETTQTPMLVESWDGVLFSQGNVE
jgi:hypothetical protein